jgi:GntR family transcriptional regulator/MocR family aminotransferase
LLAPGERLPSSRKAAADYGVSRGLIEEVYSQLLEEGLLERAVGRGTFIARRPEASSRTNLTGIAPRHDLSLSARGLELAGNRSCRVPQEFRPFNSGVADTDEFPREIWQRIQARAARDLRRAEMNFTDPRGLPALRASLAHHLTQLRGIRCSADQVIIFNSMHQALYLLALLLTQPGDTAWMEDPGYPGARAALRLAGVDIVNIPVDREGLCVAIGRREAPNSRLAYVTPAHQFPTGALMTVERRTALLEWAAARDAWVLEDDYDGEFQSVGRPNAPLFSVDPRGRVLYLGTLSKSMFVSLRLAFAVVPEFMVDPLANIRTQLDAFNPPLTQLTMSRFMDEGHFSTHVRRMRALYDAKRTVVTKGLSPLSSSGWTWDDNTMGVQLMLHHPDARKVLRTAEASGLALHLLSSYRHGIAGNDGLLLRFGGLGIPAVRDGVERLVCASQRIENLDSTRR